MFIQFSQSWSKTVKIFLFLLTFLLNNYKLHLYIGANTERLPFWYFHYQSIQYIQSWKRRLCLFTLFRHKTNFLSWLKSFSPKLCSAPLKQTNKSPWIREMRHFKIQQLSNFVTTLDSFCPRTDNGPHYVRGDTQPNQRGQILLPPPRHKDLFICPLEWRGQSSISPLRQHLLYYFNSFLKKKSP